MTYTTPHKSPQCFSCQHFFHIAKNCHNQPRCAGCGENSSNLWPRKESVDSEENSPPPSPPPQSVVIAMKHTQLVTRDVKNIQIKLQLKKSYADIVKSKAREKYIEGRKVAKTLPSNHPRWSHLLPNNFMMSGNYSAGFQNSLRSSQKLELN